MPEKEQTLIERLSNDPEVVETLTREELEQAKTELTTLGQGYVTAIKSGESEDKRADLEAAKEAKARLEAVNTRLATFQEEDDAVSAEADEVAGAFPPSEPEAETTEETPAEPEETTEVVAETETEEEPAEEAGEPEAEAEAEPTPDGEELTAVAASQPSIGALAKRTPKPKPKRKALVANAGPMVMANHADGKLHDPDELGAAALKAWQSYGSQKVDQQVLIASFPLEERGYDFEVTGDMLHDGPVIDELVKRTRTEAQRDAEHAKRAALVASGGVCAPSQPVYDFFSISESSGMIQLPSVAAPRGSLTYPVSPGYPDVRDTAAWAAAAGQEHSNADDVAGSSKANYAVECPSTQTCTVSAFPVILQFGNFAQRFYPEHVAHSIAESMTYHDHFVNATHIAAMVAASTAQGGGDTGGGGLVNVANLVGYQAAEYRDNYRMSAEAVLTLVVPTWVIDALVADLVARNATLDFGNARSRVRAVFASLNLAVQEVQDWQSLGDAAAGGFPTAADMMLYAPGTFVRLDGGSLDLGIVRDSTLNATNDFQTFVESFEIVCEIGHDSWLLDDIAVCPRGTAAADATLDCNPGFNS